MQCAKKISIISLISIIMLSGIIGCGKEAILNLTITEQPQGGVNIQLVQCTFEGEIISGDGSVEVVAKWWGFNSSCGLTLLKTESYEFDSPQPISYTTSINSALYLVLPTAHYWVEFRWTDHEGQHTIKSLKAFCEWN